MSDYVNANDDVSNYVDTNDDVSHYVGANNDVSDDVSDYVGTNNDVSDYVSCRNPTLKDCEYEAHIPEMGTWKSSGIPEISKFDCRDQKTSHWGVFYNIGKISKCRCRKWACMSRLDIYNTSYGKKKADTQIGNLTPDY